MNLCILIPLIVGLICALLGYLLGKFLGRNSSELDACNDKVAKLEADLRACNKSKLELESKPVAPTVDLGPWKSKVAKLEADLKSANDNLALSANNDEADSLKGKVSKLEADLAACKKSKAVLLGSSGLASNVSSLSANNSTSLPFDGDAAKAAFGKKIKQDDLKIVEGIGPKIEGLFHNFDIKTWKALSEASIEKCQEVLNSGGERYKIHNPGTWPKQAKLAYEGKWAELTKWQDELDGGKE